MASKAGARIKITLRCSECKQRNYNTMKNKKNTPDRLEAHRPQRDEVISRKRLKGKKGNQNG